MIVMRCDSILITVLPPHAVSLLLLACRLPAAVSNPTPQASLQLPVDELQVDVLALQAQTLQKSWPSPASVFESLVS